jgi:hypothetical protein
MKMYHYMVYRTQLKIKKIPVLILLLFSAFVSFAYTFNFNPHLEHAPNMKTRKDKNKHVFIQYKNRKISHAIFLK